MGGLPGAVPLPKTTSSNEEAAAEEDQQSDEVVGDDDDDATDVGAPIDGHGFYEGFIDIDDENEEIEELVNPDNYRPPTRQESEDEERLTNAGSAQLTSDEEADGDEEKRDEELVMPQMSCKKDEREEAALASHEDPEGHDGDNDDNVEVKCEEVCKIEETPASVEDGESQEGCDTDKSQTFENHMTEVDSLLSEVSGLMGTISDPEVNQKLDDFKDFELDYEIETYVDSDDEEKDVDNEEHKMTVTPEDDEVSQEDEEAAIEPKEQEMLANNRRRKPSFSEFMAEVDGILERRESMEREAESKKCDVGCNDDTEEKDVESEHAEDAAKDERAIISVEQEEEEVVYESDFEEDDTDDEDINECVFQDEKQQQHPQRGEVSVGYMTPYGSVNEEPDVAIAASQKIIEKQQQRPRQKRKVPDRGYMEPYVSDDEEKPDGAHHQQATMPAEQVKGEDDYESDFEDDSDDDSIMGQKGDGSRMDMDDVGSKASHEEDQGVGEEEIEEDIDGEVDQYVASAAPKKGIMKRKSHLMVDSDLEDDEEIEEQIEAVMGMETPLNGEKKTVRFSFDESEDEAIVLEDLDRKTSFDFYS